MKLLKVHLIAVHFVCAAPDREFTAKRFAANDRLRESGELTNPPLLRSIAVDF
jgi:hypothetical protein